MGPEALNNFYLNQVEPYKSATLALRDLILKQDPNITNELKYGMPFFCFKGKMFCYIWVHKKHLQPYIGIVEGNHFDETYLIQEKRSRMKIMLIDPNKDLPVKLIVHIIKKSLNLYKHGVIALKN